MGWGRRILGLLWLVALAGCGLPADGPGAREVLAPEPGAGYSLVALDEAVVRVLGDRPSLSGMPADAGPATLGPGDRIEIRIWEPSPDGLFSTPERREAVIGAEIDTDGKLFVPYAGEIRAAGLTEAALRLAIAQALTGRAVDPQVQLSRRGGSGQAVTVSGDVARPGRVDLDASGLRLRDAVALAGGATARDFETEVTLDRGARSYSARLSEIGAGLPDPRLASGDRIALSHRPRSFIALGAVGQSRSHGFEAESVTLAEALAQVRGLDDARADRGAVFVFRFESAARLTRAGVGALPPPQPEGYPTVLHLDLSDPGAFFLARLLRIEDKDIIYVADAPAAEFRKLIGTLVGPFLGGVNSALEARE